MIEKREGDRDKRHKDLWTQEHFLLEAFKDEGAAVTALTSLWTSTGRSRGLITS